MPVPTMVLIDEDLIDAARRAAPDHRRDADQQIAHWARVGRAVEQATSPDEVARALTGEVPYDALGEGAQAVVRASWQELAESRRASFDHRDTLAVGARYAELDSNERVITHTVRVP